MSMLVCGSSACRLDRVSDCDLDLYAKFLDSAPVHQAEFMADVHPDEIDFFEQLLNSRAAYEVADDRGNTPLIATDGSRKNDR